MCPPWSLDSVRTANKKPRYSKVNSSRVLSGLRARRPWPSTAGARTRCRGDARRRISPGPSPGGPDCFPPSPCNFPRNRPLRVPWNMGAAHVRRQGPRKDSAAGPPEPAPPAAGAQIPDRRTQGLTSPAADTSGLYQLNTTHTIAFPVSSEGGEAQAMRAIVKPSRRPGGPPGGAPPTAYAGGAPATPEGTGKATRRAALRGVRTSSRAACGAPASRRDALLVPSIIIG